MPFALPVTPLVGAPLVASALTAATPAAVPLPSSDFVPFQAPKGAGPKVDQAIDVELGPVQTFDPVARAQVIATELPRQWRGTYQAFGGSAAVPVQLSLASVTAVGGMVDLRGQLTIAGQPTPFQGNLNAQSDQLDLIPLASRLGGGLNPGGSFQGLQGLELSGWNANRLTDLGGRLALEPVGAGSGSAARPAAGKAVPVRGLW